MEESEYQRVAGKYGFHNQSPYEEESPEKQYLRAYFDQTRDQITDKDWDPSAFSKRILADLKQYQGYASKQSQSETLLRPKLAVNLKGIDSNLMQSLDRVK